MGLWLLEWEVAWQDGAGKDLHHQVYRTKGAALDQGENLLREKYVTLPLPEFNKYVGAFRQERDDGTFYCSGVMVKPVQYVRM